ncbi:MAG: hypothetical protein OXB84_07835, partial [Halobacteriovoraceae bacterium]|nr:hypothetical protein [Halobacteriovoraceae bacterium]
MDFKINIIVKALVIFFLLFFFSKPLYHLWELFKEIIMGKNRGGHDLEAMIAQKKAGLSINRGSSDMANLKRSKNPSDSWETKYTLLYEKNKDSEIEKMLDLIRGLQWGSEGIIDEIGKSFFKKYGRDLTSSRIVGVTREILYGKFVEMAIKSRDIPTFSQVREIIHLFLLAYDDKLGWDVRMDHAQKGLATLLDKKRSPVLLLMKNKKE